MRVTLFIDTLACGGAERQLCNLALCLHDRGYRVTVLVRVAALFYAPLLAAAGIPVKVVEYSNKIQTVLKTRRAIRASEPDVVIAYLENASLLAELSGLPRRDFALIVSERGGEEKTFIGKRIYRYMHYLADAVVTNSHTAKDDLDRHHRGLPGRTRVITNSVDFATFKSAPVPRRPDPAELHILVVANVIALKNPLGLLRALVLLRDERPDLSVRVDWYGSYQLVSNKGSRPSACYEEARREIARHGLQASFRFHGPVAHIDEKYRAADAMCLPSFSEGCPNAIGEAMACGVPVLASRVDDNERLVSEGENGFLFDPRDPASIADAIARLADLPREQRQRLGGNGRRRAERLLDSERFADEYIQLIEDLRR